MGRYKWNLCPRFQRRLPGTRSRSRCRKQLGRWTSSWQTETIVCFVVLCSLMLPVTSEFLESYTNVPMEPVFLETNTNITAREGGKAVLPCKIQHLGTKKVAWRSVDLEKFMTVGTMSWLPDDKVEVMHVPHPDEVEEWSLLFHSVRKSDAGLYECQLASVAGYAKHVKLTVVGPPITDPDVTLTGTQFVERGGQILLQCNATGGVQIAEQIDWFKDGNIISGPRFKDYVIYTYRSYEDGALVSTLQVDRAGGQHAGTYVCRSSYNKLKDIAVQVLVADSSNVKRGTVSSNNSSSCPLSQSTLYLFIGLVVTHWTIGN
ncbi:zwei Ig domain protein zig-8-like isoform X2 [Physella acuta]|uniref:zwei Ig domain protein zig-8-like isoform X2 n=1 Tax=Physella acuta TaxID=109671 RepID=UPI0027DE641B|nr:zwei Ig domain protein zig-8-like isoform X2 [Physella acuta]